MAGCRIRSVTYKKSPHLTEIIPKKRVAEALIVQDAKRIYDNFNGKLAGYYVIAFGYDASISRAFDINNDAPFGITLMGSMIKEVISTDITKVFLKD